VFLFNKTALFKRTKIAIFHSNEIVASPHSIDLVFGENIKDHCNNSTLKLLWVLKWNTIGPSFLAVLFYFVSFILTAAMHNDAVVDLDLIAFVFAVINHLYSLSNYKQLRKIKFFRTISNLRDWLSFGALLELVVFFVSLFTAFLLQPININSSVLSKLGIAFIFLDALINMAKRDQ